MIGIDPRQIKDDERRYFDEHLDEYVAQFCRGRWLAYKRYIASQISALLPPRPVVLDLGSGPLPAFDRLVPSAARYVCADFSPRNLRHLRGHVPHAAPVMADAEVLPFASRAFDLVIVFGLLHHLPDPGQAVREIRRVLRPGAVVIASEPSTRWEGRMASPHERGLAASELRSLFEAFNQRLWSFNHPLLEGWAALAAQRVPAWQDAEAPLWRALFTAERLAHAVGVRGWDYLLIARAAG